MDFSEGIKIEPIEWVGIISFSFFILVTLNFSLSLLLFLLTLGLFKFIELSFFYKDKLFFEHLKNLNNKLFFVFLILFFIDVILTYLGVFYFNVAFEKNQKVKWWWDNFGYFKGEFLRVSLGIVFLGFLKYLNRFDKAKVVIFVSFVFLIVFWVSVDLNNLNILLKSLC